MREKTREGAIAKKGDPLTEHDYSNHSQQVIQKYKRIHKSGKSLLGVEQKRLANERCQRYIEYKDPTYKNKILKERFVADFAPLLKEADLEKIRLTEMSKSGQDGTLYIRILDAVEKIIKNTTPLVDKQRRGNSIWRKLSTVDKERIEHSLKKIQKKKAYQKEILTTAATGTLG